jgi:ABC-type glycerol-3-phosphate transport system substrate-binding protein
MAKIRTLAAFVAGGALAVAASGCASPGEGSNDSLTYWSMWKEGEAQQQVLADAIADFEEQTGISVDVQWQGRDNVKKVVPALNTNKVPDLVDGSFAKLAPVLAETGQAMPLADAYAAEVDGTPASELVPSTYLGAEELSADGDAPWMMPYSLTSDAIWFNAAAHPELAEQPPATWDEFVDTLDDLKAAGEAPLAIDGDVAGYNASWYTTAMVRVAGPGALKEIAADESGEAWDAPEALRAAELVQQLVDGDYVVDGYNASKWPAQQQAWADDQSALLFNGTWIPTETASYAADGFEYSSFPFPRVGDGALSQRADFIGFTVPAKAKNADAAQELAAFFLGKEYQDALGTEARILPIRPDAAVSPEMTTVKDALDSADGYHQQNDGITFPGYTEKLLWPALDKLVLGEISAAEFVDRMKAGQADYWKQNS